MSLRFILIYFTHALPKSDKYSAYSGKSRAFVCLSTQLQSSTPGTSAPETLSSAVGTLSSLCVWFQRVSIIYPDRTLLIDPIDISCFVNESLCVSQRLVITLCQQNPTESEKKVSQDKNTWKKKCPNTEALCTTRRFLPANLKMRMPVKGTI